MASATRPGLSEGFLRDVDAAAAAVPYLELERGPDHFRDPVPVRGADPGDHQLYTAAVTADAGEAERPADPADSTQRARCLHVNPVDQAANNVAAMLLEHLRRRRHVQDRRKHTADAAAKVLNIAEHRFTY